MWTRADPAARLAARSSRPEAALQCIIHLKAYPALIHDVAELAKNGEKVAFFTMPGGGLELPTLLILRIEDEDYAEVVVAVDLDRVQV